MYDFTETTTASSRELELTHRLQLNTKYFVLEYVASELMVVSGLSRLVGFRVTVMTSLPKRVLLTCKTHCATKMI